MFRKRLVEGASSTNTLQIMTSESGCCGDAQTICKYRIIIDPWVSMASITITKDGEDVVVPLTPAVTDITLLADGIRAALATEGYILDEDVLDVVITTDGTERTLDIYGEAVIVEVTSNASVVDTATAMCESYVDCLYTATVPVGVLTISVDGAEAEELNGGDAYGTGEAATLVTDIEGSTQLGDATAVAVTEDTDLETFTITLRYPRAEIAFGDTVATRSDCHKEWREA